MLGSCRQIWSFVAGGVSLWKRRPALSPLCTCRRIREPEAQRTLSFLYELPLCNTSITLKPAPLPNLVHPCMLLCSSCGQALAGMSPIHDIWGQVKWTRSLPSAGSFGGTLPHTKTISPTVEERSLPESLEAHVLHHSDP